MYVCLSVEFKQDKCVNIKGKWLNYHEQASFCLTKEMYT